MIADQISAAVAEARSGAALDNLARLVWRGFSEGHIDELAADLVSQAIQARRESLSVARAARSAVSAPVSPSKPRRAPRTPDRQRSIERRRRLAASGALPPALATKFTTGEIAVLSVIAREIQRQGRCELHVDAVAALAGVCRRLVQNALRAAAAASVIVVHERRRRGAPSLSNVVTIVDPSWRAWLRLSSGQGARSYTPRSNKFSENHGGCAQPSPGSSEAPLFRLQSVSGTSRLNANEGRRHDDPIRKRQA